MQLPRFLGERDEEPKPLLTAIVLVATPALASDMALDLTEFAWGLVADGTSATGSPSNTGLVSQQPDPNLPESRGSSASVLGHMELNNASLTASKDRPTMNESFPIRDSGFPGRTCDPDACN